MKILDKRVLHAKGEDSDAIDSSLKHAPYSKLHTLSVVNRGSKQDFVVVLNGQVFKSLNDLGEKWVCDLRNNQAKHATAAGTKRTRCRVGVIAKLFHNLPYSSS